MKSGPDQIALPLDWPQSAGDIRLILSDANRDAFDHFRKWSMWPVKATILTGPRRSGRTLLARSFVERVHGRLFDGAERGDEQELFHAWNDAQDSGRPLVMITDMVPPAMAAAAARPANANRGDAGDSHRLPDDRLFSGLIELLFADRGLHVPGEALRFMVERIERDYWAAERAVEIVDRFAIAERARLTLPTIRRALADANLIGRDLS